MEGPNPGPAPEPKSDTTSESPEAISGADGDLTPTQRQLLARIITEGLAKRYNSQPEKTRATWLRWFAVSFDDLIWREIERTLRAGPVLRTVPSAHDTWTELRDALARGDEFAVEPIANRIGREFGDDHSYHGFKLWVRKVLSGDVTLRDLEECLDAAMKKGKNRGAYFERAMQSREDRSRSPQLQGAAS